MNRPRNYWRNLARFALIVVALALSGATLWLSYSRALILAHPARNHAARTPADAGIAIWEDVAFASSDGLQLRGWFIPPDPRTRAAIVFLHGLATNRDHLLDEAARLASYGYGALLFDLRNHGASAGAITTLGYAEVEDVRGAVNYLLTRSEVDPQCIGLMGHSMGAGTALRAAARIPHVRAVIAASAYTSIEDNLADGVEGLTGLPAFPFAPLVIWFGERETGLDIRKVRPVDDIAKISPRAVMLIHGELDPLIPVRNARQLYQAAREPKQLYIAPNAGHVGLLAANPREWERRVLEFLTRGDALGKCD
ncbi:MAG: alpha/beta fold hydrolase [Chloroflexi bacterium]|nr:alpha/beta fold hydrolase [Chloroflexota bacterium]